MKKQLIIICHIDSVFNENILHLGEKGLVGSLDNLIGIMAISRFLPLLQEYDVKVYFTIREEVDQKGAKEIIMSYTKDIERTIVLNIDCDELIDDNTICSIDNISGYTKEEIQELKDIILYWFEDGKEVSTTYYSNKKDNPNYEDDSWKFAEKDFKVFTLTYPVKGKFHTTNCSISIQAFEDYCQSLKCVLYYLINETMQ